MTIMEIRIEPKTETSCAVAHFAVDDKEYMVIACSNCVTVLADRWINDHRALGKTFWKPEELESHYKKHGKIILEYANRIANWN